MNTSEIVAKHVEKYLLSMYNSENTSLQKMNRDYGALDAIESIAADMGYTIYICEMTDSCEIMIEHEGKVKSKFIIKKEAENEKIN